MSNTVERYINKIKTSNTDPWVYKGLVMKNGLTVLLISDPSSEHSAISLSVAAGSLCDPDDLPGLAHLCEHMLFCGTKKYSRKNEFKNFLIRNRGEYSSQTKLDHSKFYCCIKNNKFKPLLDRFARMFFEPLLDKNDILRGVATINYRYKNNFSNDVYRVEQAMKSSKDKVHPINRFGLGSIDTLWINPVLKKISVHKRLVEHYSTWYSSHLMKLVVVGKENLETLEKLIVPLFGKIEQKIVNFPKCPEQVYKKEQLGVKTFIVPLVDMQFLSIEFSIPDQKIFYKSMPAKYLSTLFTDEGPSSLFAVLKNNGWCSRMSANNLYKTKGIEIYNFVFILTKRGLGHVDDIVAFFFQYVNMLKREKPQEWFFREIQSSNATQFHFKDKEYALKNIYWLSSQMMYYNLDEVLEAENIFGEWRPDLIENILSYFTPDNIRVTVVGKIFQQVAKDVEEHYGTKYLTTKIPAEVLDSWKNIGVNEVFKMPSRNKFIASDMNLIPDNKSMALDHPHIIYESSLIRCWFKSDTEFKCPKTSITVEFSSPTVLDDPFHVNIMQFVVSLFNNYISEHKCNAQRAGTNIIIIPKVTGLMIKLYGYSQKIDVLLHEIIDKLITFKIDRERFDIHKENYIESIRMQPHNQKAIKYSYEMLSEAAQNSIGFLSSINGIQIEQIEDFMKKFLSHGIFMEALVFGNIDQKKTERIIRILEKPFLAYGKFGKKVTHQINKPRDTALENGEDVVFETIGFRAKNACVFMNLQCGVQSPMNNMVFFLFNHIMEDVFFKYMYKERHQYPLQIVPSTNKGLLYLGIIDQSSHELKTIHSKIDKYINSIKEALGNMSDTQFKDYKISMYNNMLKKPRTLKRKAENYEYDVFVQNYNFNRVQSEVDALRSITINDICKFYNNKISQYGRKRRKLTVHVKPLTSDDEDNGEGTQSSAVTDMVDFKRKRTQLYQLPNQPIPHKYYS